MAALPIGQVDSGGRSFEVKWDKDTKEVFVAAPNRRYAFNTAQKKAASAGVALEIAEQALRDNGPWAQKVDDAEPRSGKEAPMNTKPMRSRDEIQKDLSEARKSDKAAVLVQEYVLEVLLDIRDLLTSQAGGK